MNIVLQKIVFPNTNICSLEDLYYRKIGLPSTTGFLCEGSKFFARQRVNFDTYFNSFSLLKWIKYTNTDHNFKLKIKLKGKFRINLIHMFLEANSKLNYHVIDSFELINDSIQEYILPYFTQNPFGCLTFSLECLEDGGEFVEASYVADSNINPKKIELAIGICTFKREKYVINNINNLKKHILENNNSEVKDNIRVFVVDNAGTIKTNFKNDKVKLIKNKNTGGSGGFTRSLVEAIKSNDNGDKITHILLMDDDVVFDPTSIERTCKLLSLLKDEYMDAFIGGAMFKINNQAIQHASGESWHGDNCESFVETFNSNRNMIELIDILENENFTDSNYQAWWFCAMPMTICKYDNLPLPLFIKSDDIEFSIRNAKDIILLNGINVWHESFESKYSAANEYYTVRNFLISSSVQKQKVSKENVITMMDNYVKHYSCNYKYLEIEHLCNAINDFLKGVDYFKSIDLESFHKTLLPKNYKMLDYTDIPVNFDDGNYFRDISYNENRSKLKRLVAKLTVNGLFLPAKGFAVLGMWGGTYEQTYRKKFLVRYEINTKKGFVLTRNRSLFIKNYKLYKKTRKNVINNFDRIKQEFFDRKTELYNISTWENNLIL